jgi:hypothetical protein
LPSGPKSDPAIFDAYGEWHENNHSVCVSAHIEFLDPAAEPDLQRLIEKLANVPVAPVASILLEHVAEEIAKRLATEITEVDPADLLVVLVRRLLAKAHTRFSIDVLGTDDLLARKAAGRRNDSGLNTADPTVPEIP